MCGADWCSRTGVLDGVFLRSGSVPEPAEYDVLQRNASLDGHGELICRCKS